MLSLRKPYTYPQSFKDYPELQQLWLTTFPQDKVYNINNSSNFVEKISYNAGRSLGLAKSFFSKTETKVATLIAYWAADAFVALVLILSAVHPISVAIALAMLILHTYATFSIVSEVI